MSIKTALLEMKDALLNHHAGSSVEEFIQDLEIKNELRSGTLVVYYNHLMMVMNRVQQEHSSNQNSKKVNRKWTKFEIDFMFQYIRERQDEGALNITEILEETANLLDRGYQSVNYKYYTLTKSKSNEDKVEQNAYQFTTIGVDHAPVISAKVVDDNTPPVTAEIEDAASVDDDGLLDILSGLITNVQQLPGIQLKELLKSLYQLTNLALQNQGVVHQLETIKEETSREKDQLQDQLKKQEQQLLNERKRNDELQQEVSKLAKEIMAFNQLGDAAKIQNLKTYNQRLNYIIDSFGLVLRVGS